MASRVLCVDDGLGLWGAQYVLLQLAEPLRRRGIELVLAAPPHSALSQAWTSRGFDFQPLQLPTPPSPRTADGRVRWRALAQMTLSSPRAISAIRGAIRASRADAVLGNSHPTQLDTAIAGRSLGVPVALYVHEQLPFRFGRMVRAAAALLSQRVIAVSRAVGAEIPLVPQSRVQVVHNGVDTQLFCTRPAEPAVVQSLGARPDELLLVALTRLDPVKRVEDLLSAATALAAHAANPDWHLAIVGETTDFPDYAEQLRARAKTELAGRVTFAGRRSDVPEVLRAADVVVHAGTVEGLPLGLLEAQSCGRPVVAYRVAGIPELVRDDETGLLADCADVSGMVSRLDRLLNDDALRERLGRQAASRVRSEFDSGLQADRLARLVGKL